MLLIPEVKTFLSDSLVWFSLSLAWRLHPNTRNQAKGMLEEKGNLKDAAVVQVSKPV
jgi:hypothetical protein